MSEVREDDPKAEDDGVIIPGKPIFDEFVRRVRADREGIGKLKATLHRVGYGHGIYRCTFEETVYEIEGRPFCRCGKDRCLSAEHEMTLAALVNEMDIDWD